MYVTMMESYRCNELLDRFHYSGTQPKLHQLQSLNIEEKNIRIIDSVAADWEEVAIALHFDVPEIATVRLECHHQPKPACRMILSKWLNGQGCQPPTWERLTEALSDANFPSLAQDLQQILGPSWTSSPLN